MAPDSYDDCADQDRLEPIAVVGLSLRFPQDATSSESLWNMLMEGRCAMTEVPEDRWNLVSFYHPDAERKDSVCGQLLCLHSQSLCCYFAVIYPGTDPFARRTLLERRYLSF